MKGNRGGRCCRGAWSKYYGNIKKESKNMRKKYLELEIVTIRFEECDVLTLSGGVEDNDDKNDVMGDDPYGGF